MDVSIANLNPYAFSVSDYRTSNGDVAITSLNTRSLSVATSNGCITAQRVRGLTGTATLRSKNGRIECQDCSDRSLGRSPISWEVFTSNGGVSGRFAAANHIKIRTTGGLIEGYFIAPSITLDTANAKIKAVVANVGEKGAQLKTSNGDIDVAFAVTDLSTSLSKAIAIPLHVSTSNGNLLARLDTLSPPVGLDVKLRTSNGDLTWHGHREYQGSFVFSTTPVVGRVSVNTADSSDRDGKRDVVITKVVESPWGDDPSTIQGTIAKLRSDKRASGMAWGSIVGKTSNGEVVAVI